MKIGGYRIEGVSTRFFVIAGAALFCIVLAIYVYSTRPAPPDPLKEPAFPASELTQASPGFLDDYVDAFGLDTPESFDEMTQSYSANLGQPMRFRAYIPPRDALEGSFSLRKFGKEFVPAVFIDPTQTVTADDLSNGDSLIQNAQFLALGFSQDEVAEAGKAYEISGLLYWNTFQLRPPSDEEIQSGAESSPVVLVDSFRPLSLAELRAPTTHYADTDVTYQEGPLRMSVKRIEWSAGREMRACISLQNISSRAPVPLWDGINQVEAYKQGSGSVQGVIDEDSAFAFQGDINPGQTVPGYVVFSDSVTSPEGGVVITMPSLKENHSGSEAVDQFRIGIQPSQVKAVSQTDYSSRSSRTSGGCQAATEGS